MSDTLPVVAAILERIASNASENPRDEAEHALTLLRNRAKIGPDSTLDEVIINVMPKLRYDPETGELTWLYSGKPAGSIPNKNYNNYIYLQHLGRQVAAHRVCWALYHGHPPPSPIDHINGIKSDNRIANLRLATVAENNRNRGRQSNNTSGFKGVIFHKGKWNARVQHMGKRHCLGAYDSREEASAVYEAAAKQMFGEFTGPANAALDAVKEANANG